MSLPPLVEEHLTWWIAGVIIVGGLLIYGFRDVLRFSFRRAWAISGVCFDESIRRRVLWITPLAIVGAVIVTQLQNPTDAQDAVRQTIKFCLFATGLVVTMTAIILAATNLPKEIETRVIYTIVTKPTTRLEIVVGKVLGFARVSATILLIMGVFMFAYLHVRAWSLRRDVRERLAAGAVDPLSRPTMEYYASAGLLGANSYLRPVQMQVFSRVPDPTENRLYTFGGGDESFAVPFDVTPAQLTPPGVDGAPPGALGMFIRLNLGFQATAAAEEAGRTRAIPETVASPTQPSSWGGLSDALISVQILDQDFTSLVAEGQINGGLPVRLTDPSGATPVLLKIAPEATASILQPGREVTRVWVQVTGESREAEYFISTANNANPVSLIVPGASQEQRRVLLPPVDPEAPYRRVLPLFRGRVGSYGQQLRGGEPGAAPVAIFKFRADSDAPTIRAADGRVPFELRVGIERSGENEDDALTQVEVRVINRATGFTSEPIYVSPESTRANYFTAPAQAVGEGNFEVRLRNLTAGNYVGLRSTSLAAVASKQSFNVNLVKSLVIMWLMAILVVIIAIFCSTFLSWPIAIVLTVVILLGHWAVMQLGDDAGPGVGARIAQDLGFENAAQTKAVSNTVEALSRVLRTVANVLPDISKFAAVEDIERGVTIPARRLHEPLLVLLTFGLPMLVVAYVILRNKEVAP